MSSEALLENPKLFSSEGDHLFATDYSRSQLRCVREYLELVFVYPNPRPLCKIVRAHLFKLLYRYYYYWCFVIFVIYFVVDVCLFACCCCCFLLFLLLLLLLLLLLMLLLLLLLLL